MLQLTAAALDCFFAKGKRHDDEYFGHDGHPVFYDRCFTLAKCCATLRRHSMEITGRDGEPRGRAWRFGLAAQIH
jgi:hypothetical protein